MRLLLYYDIRLGSIQSMPAGSVKSLAKVNDNYYTVVATDGESIEALDCVWAESASLIVLEEVVLELPN